MRSGNAEVATAGGPVRVADGQRVRLEGRAEFASLVTPRAADDFDEWVLEREVQFAESAPPPGEPSDDYEYGNETLDQYGEWRDEPSYGRVWMPSYAYGGYDPFSHGTGSAAASAIRGTTRCRGAPTPSIRPLDLPGSPESLVLGADTAPSPGSLPHDTRPYRQPRAGDRWDDDRDDRNNRDDRPWNGNRHPDTDDPQPVAD